MGLFGKKKEEKKDMSSLPDLPKLPEFPNIKNSEENEQIPQLPSFPSNSLGNKFSQDTIKEAVTGKKEETQGSSADDFFSVKNRKRMMQEPLEEHNIPTKIIRRELDDDEDFEMGESLPKVPKTFRKAASRIKEAEPVFIRLDKFEEALKLFEKTQDKIEDIEKNLRDIKTIKDEEEKELEIWEGELRKIKNQIEKVDQDIFSKIE